MSPLLEKALAVPVKRRLNQMPVDWDLRDRVELAIAFFEGRVTTAQVCTALGRVNDQNVNSKMGSVLGSAIRRGLVEVKIAGQQQQQTAAAEEQQVRL